MEVTIGEAATIETIVYARQKHMKKFQIILFAIVICSLVSLIALAIWSNFIHSANQTTNTTQKPEYNCTTTTTQSPSNIRTTTAATTTTTQSPSIIRTTTATTTTTTRPDGIWNPLPS